MLDWREKIPTKAIHSRRDRWGMTLPGGDFRMQETIGDGFSRGRSNSFPENPQVNNKTPDFPQK